MNMSMNLTCPYCGHTQLYRIDADGAMFGKDIITCGMDDGGCDNDFAVFWSLTLSARVRQIEGEGKYLVPTPPKETT